MRASDPEFAQGPQAKATIALTSPMTPRTIPTAARRSSGRCSTVARLRNVRRGRPLPSRERTPGPITTAQQERSNRYRAHGQSRHRPSSSPPQPPWRFRVTGLRSGWRPTTRRCVSAELVDGIRGRRESGSARSRRRPARRPTTRGHGSTTARRTRRPSCTERLQPTAT